jgi:basic membrane protein A and related proteins
VRISRWITIAVVGALTAAVAATTALGGGRAPAARDATVKVAVVTDIGGLNDKGFNHLAYVGLQRAEKQLGVRGRVYITQSAQDRLGNLQAAAQQGYGLVIATGFLFFDQLPKVAPSFTSTSFAGIDIPIAAVTGTPSNVRGLVFPEQQPGYLVGYIAGLMIKRHPHNGKQVVSAVGANPVPAIVHYLAGFRAGAKKADPGVTVLTNYANDPTFNDQAKCKVTTQNQISRGSGIVFEAAGGCGLGGLTAAKQAGIWGIGVDANQGYLGPHILTSALKRVDVAVFDAAKEYQADPSSFKGGVDTVFDLKNGGVGYAPLSPKVSPADRAYITPRVARIEKLIASGKIVPPTK